MDNSLGDGVDDIGERIRQSTHILLALDYDGTLTPIVDDPACARLSPAMRRLLSDLAQRTDVDVAIISGRSLVDLQQMVGIPGLTYAGNHGMEIAGPAMQFCEPAATASVPLLHELALDLTAKLRHIRGVVVENKGLTLSIHYRRVTLVDVEEVERTVLRAVEPVRDRIHVTRGAKVYEVRPLVHWDKGAALEWIVAQLSRTDTLVTYIGDDATDEDAFEALRGNGITIKVGDNSTATAARYLFSSPAVVQDFLHWVHAVLMKKRDPQDEH